MNISSVPQTDIDKTLGWVVSACAFLFPVLVLTVNRADSAILLLLGIIGLYAFLKCGVRNLMLSQQEIFIIGIFVVWYAVIVLCYFMGDQTDTGFKMLGRNLRLAIFAPAFIANRHFLKRPTFFLTGLAAAPFAILSLSLWQAWHGHVRVSGFVDAIPFGDLAIAMAFMSTAVLFTLESPISRWRYYIAGAGLAAGIVASILSESRGGWLAIPFMVLVLSMALSKNSRQRGIKIFALSLVVIVVAAILVPRAIIFQRVSSAMDNVRQYLQYRNLVDSGDLNSIGCVSNKALLSEIVKSIQDSYGKNVDAHVTDNIDPFKDPTLGRWCHSRFAIMIKDKSDKKANFAVIQRFVRYPGGVQTVDFVIKGKGSIAINGVQAGKASFDNRNFGLVGIRQNIDRSYHADPYLFIEPGHSIFVIPVQNQIGEYLYPLINNSIGQRLEMWRAAWLIFRDHVFMGAGTGAYMAEVKKISKGRRVFPAIDSYDHPHNDYLNSLSSQGVLGVVTYLMALIYPLILYFKALTQYEKYQKAAGYVGIIMVLGLLVFGMTETMFAHSIVMSWYVTFTAMLMAIIFRQKDTETHDVGSLWEKYAGF